MAIFFIALTIFSKIAVGTARSKRAVWETQAKKLLREYGEAQFAYQQTNNNADYGAWDTLFQKGYIVAGFDRGNYFKNYSLWTSVELSEHRATSQPPLFRSTFTAVTFPHTTRPPGYLATFAIREDQVLRVYRLDTESANYWGENDDYGCRTWVPIK